LADSPKHFTVEGFTASDHYRLHYRRYAAAKNGPARGHVVFLHGIQSHSGWYAHSCSRLAQAGFDISFLDRRGSGMNRENRGDAPSFKRLLRDVAEFIDHVGADAAHSALFLAGISWGAKLALALQCFQPKPLAGIVLICPGLCPKVRPPLGQRLQIAWARVTTPTRLFPIPLNDPELFTSTPRWLDFLRGDSLSLHRATARFLVESVRLDRYLRRVPKLVHAPVLLMLAEKDRIIDNAATRRLAQRLAPEGLRVIEYPGAHHTLEFEPDPERFIADMIDWLQQRVP
jgi:alpha-beta hydrolase superfamily lysophospholipase